MAFLQLAAATVEDNLSDYYCALHLERRKQLSVTLRCRLCAVRSLNLNVTTESLNFPACERD